MAEMRHQHAPVLLGIARRAQEADRLGAREVAALTGAFGSLGLRDAELYGFGRHLAQSPDLDEQSISNVLHGHALAGVLHDWALHLLLHELPPLLLPGGRAAAGDAASREGQMLGQAFQYILMPEARGLLEEGVRQDPAFLTLREGLREYWLDKCVEASPSMVQLEIFEIVRTLPGGCAEAVSEQLTEDGLFSMDIGLQLPGGLKLALEVDGPQHFMANCRDEASGETRLRRLLVEARGWKVVSLPVQQWREVVRLGGEQAGREHLMALLREAGAQL